MSQPKISKGNKLWFSLESRLLDLFLLAMAMMLREGKSFPVKEDSISRKLDKYIRKANEKLRKDNAHVDNLPVFQAQNQPDHDLPEGNHAERKKPDFLWQWYDDGEAKYYKRYKEYAIECKRLDKDKSELCKHYVTRGVCRFIDPKHSYSKHSSSGMMIGYIQGGEGKEILATVNTEAGSNSLSGIKLSPKGWKKNGVSRLDHELDRPKVPPTPFQLRHFWLDLQ